MRPTLLMILALIVARGAEAASALPEAIQEGFAAVRELKPMRPGNEYSVPVNGIVRAGRKERFLRCRTLDEILASKLSTGCGDNAVVFLDRMEKAGFEALLVDSAEISSASLLNTFSGHAVVAVRESGDKGEAPWHLVDSTNLKILSDKWSREERSFKAFGRLFWIGYCGPAAKYPVHTPGELKRFYAATLASVPRSVLSSELVQLQFTIDPSLLKPDQSLVNPRLSGFVALQNSVFESCGIMPKQSVPILLKRGGEDAQTSLAFSEAGGWIARVGTESGCSSSLLDYMERTVKQRLRAAH